jgi:predicted acetyltransferase
MRLCTRKDEPDLREMWRVCFGDPPTYIDYFFENRFDPYNAVCLEEDGRIPAAMHIVPYEVDIRGNAFTTAYLVGVATLPEYRMRGMSKALIREGLRLCRQRGYRFSHLYPFLHSFYARLGYGIANRRLLASLDAERAELLPHPIKVRAMSLNDADAALDCYRRFMAGKNGYVVRSSMDGRLAEHLLESPALAAVDSRGNMAGYCLCYMEDGVLTADELVFGSPGALSSLLHAMGALAGETEMRFTLPEGETPPEEWGIKTRVEDYAMVRIIHLDGLNVPAPMSVAGEVVLRIRDAFLPEQEGVYRAVARDGRVTFTRCGETPEGEMDILLLSELVCGNPPLGFQPKGAGEKALFQMLPTRPCLLFEKY